MSSMADDIFHKSAQKKTPAPNGGQGLSPDG
jgi:hypothetical protein